MPASRVAMLRLAGTTVLASAAACVLAGSSTMAQPGGADFVRAAAGDLPEVIEGGFMSSPEGFAAAPASVRHVLKYWNWPAIRDGQPCVEYSSTSMLVDYSNVDPQAIDTDAIVTDCDLLKRIASQSPQHLQQMLAELQ